MLLVRERPPLNLDIEIDAGNTYRWGEDEPSAANKPDGLTFSTTMPGGFEEMSCTLERDPRYDYPDLQELSNVTVRGLGGSTVAWQGRIEEFPSTAGAQAQITPQCYGWQNHLSDDNAAAMIYVDQTLSTWAQAPLTRQIAALAANETLQNGPSIASDPATSFPQFVLEIDGAWISPYEPYSEAWYDAQDSGLIAKLYYYIGFNQGGDSNWNLYIGLSSDASTAAESLGPFADSGSVSGYWTPGTPERYALAQFSYRSTRPATTTRSTRASGGWRSMAITGCRCRAPIRRASWPPT